ncbi:hypothetical protein D3C72_2174730 [compost metagenome]
MLPISTICARLAACAPMPTSAMKTGIKGAAMSRIKAAIHDSGVTTARITSGTSITFQRAGL